MAARSPRARVVVATVGAVSMAAIPFAAAFVGSNASWSGNTAATGAEPVPAEGSTALPPALPADALDLADAAPAGDPETAVTPELGEPATVADVVLADVVLAAVVAAPAAAPEQPATPAPSLTVLDLNGGLLSFTVTGYTGVIEVLDNADRVVATAAATTADSGSTWVATIVTTLPTGLYHARLASRPEITTAVFAAVAATAPAPVAERTLALG